MTPYDNFETTDARVAALLDAIQKNPEDDTARLVLADLIDELLPDQHALSTLYRGGAKKWLEEFAARCGHHSTNYNEWCGNSHAIWCATREGDPVPEKIDQELVPITYDLIVKAAEEYVESDGDDVFIQYGEEDLRNEMADDATREMFWKCFSVVTGIIVDPDRSSESPFSCMC